MNTIRWHTFADANAVATAAAQWILDAATAAIARHGRFSLVLAGGTTPALSYRLLAQARAQWDAWYIYFGDERCLPAHHPERNSVMAHQTWLAHVPLPSTHIYPIAAELGPHQAAKNYHTILAAARPFDLVLLGMGEDGHTASLFPGHTHPAHECVHPVLHAPKPPCERVSLSASALADSHTVLLLVTGASKHAAVVQWQQGADLPIANIHPPTGMEVLLDRAALNGV
jgi:6-phosphogluconolactonase